METIEEILDESGSRFTRKRLVKLAGAGALGTLGLAAITPALSLGPAFDTSELEKTPWRRGRRLVDESGKPIATTEIEAESFYTAYPEGADRELIGSPLVVVRIGPGNDGVVAYSKICTHAGCAIALYRKPTFPDTQPGPALVCPCHYSSFDPADERQGDLRPRGPRAAAPAARDRRRTATCARRATSTAPVGPSWSGVRQHGARS